MSEKEYYRFSSLVFLIVAIAHAIRAFYGWDAIIGGVEIPVWYSWVAVVLAGYLAFRGFSMVNKLGGHSKAKPRAKAPAKRK
jgi:hypothetical protein